MLRLPRIIALLAAVITCSSLPSRLDARPALPRVRDAKVEGGSLAIQLDGARVILTPLTAQAMEYRVETPDSIQQPPSLALADPAARAQATLTERGDTLLYTTTGLTATVRKSPFSIRFARDGKTILETTGAPSTGATPEFSFRITSGEHFFGGGSRVLGHMNRRGEKFELYGMASYGYETEAKKMYYSMPLVLSSDKYGILFDNTARGELDLDSAKTNTLRFSSVGGRRSCIIYAAETWADLCRETTALTGRQPLLPRWTWGNISSRMGYRSQRQVLDIARLYDLHDVPLDAMVLDLYWFGADLKGHMGTLDWDRVNFPEPEQMIDQLHQVGIHTVLITEPFILNTSKRWQDACDNGVLAPDASGKPGEFDMFFGRAALIDIFKPEARQWFWDIYKKHTLTGVDGWWGDLGEPEAHPSDLIHTTGPADEVHNGYGHEWARLLAEGYAQDFPDKRPVILMRSGFAGSQRHGMVPWSGDVKRTWGGLTPQVEISLQMGLQGLAYMHSDLGGFAEPNKDSELYQRWLQYGVFQPIFRTHAQEDVAPEPVMWDDATLANARRQILLRYRMLPYNQTLMWENTTTGMPLMRPLFMDDANPELIDYQDAYLWGRDFLVSAITEKGQREKSIRFPADSVWIDFHNGSRYEGGKLHRVPVSPDDIPVFARAGSVIPMTADDMANTTAYDPAKLALHYYADPTVKSATSQLYDDDGLTPGSISDNRYELISFTARQSGNHVRIEAIPREGGAYPGKPETREFTYFIHSLPRAPRSVRVDDQELSISPYSHSNFDSVAPTATWQKETRILRVPVTWSGKPLSLMVLCD